MFFKNKIKLICSGNYRRLSNTFFHLKSALPRISFSNHSFEMEATQIENYAENFFRTPLSARYGCNEMSENFSDTKKFTTWRKLWLELAKAERVYTFYYNLFGKIYINFFLTRLFKDVSFHIGWKMWLQTNQYHHNDSFNSFFSIDHIFVEKLIEILLLKIY